MEASTSIKVCGSEVSNNSHACETKHSKEFSTGTFMCSFCPLTEAYDYKGRAPPFARQCVYLEECYIMKDPFSLLSKGEVLVLGADCSLCKKSVCLGCSLFYSKRFCKKCAHGNIAHLPPALHSRINNLIKDEHN